MRLFDILAPSPYAHYLCWRTGTMDRWECAAFAEIRQLARSIAHGLVSDAVDAGRSTRTGGLSRTPLALVG
ncbi:MAG TPA: hypothetical protein PKO41_05745 [Dokdonella sp.]|nr:hypothetical protein [Dokdonella sp.]